MNAEEFSAQAQVNPQIQNTVLRRLQDVVHAQEAGTFFVVDDTRRMISRHYSLLDFELESSLPACLRHATWPRSVCVGTPASFDVEKLTGIVILDVLAVLHSHPRDKDLLFRDVDHSYTWRGQRVSLSVTGLIHSLAQSFNPTAALAAMRRGKNWPRPEYVAPNMVQELQRLLEGDASVPVELMHLVSGREIDVAAVCRRLRDLIWTHPGYEYLVTAASLSDSQILAKWERNRSVAAAEGTWLHAKCECLLNGGSVPIASPEICMFLKFVRLFQAEGWTFRRTEWAIYASAEDLAGSIDAWRSAAMTSVLSIGRERNNSLPKAVASDVTSDSQISAAGCSRCGSLALPCSAEHSCLDSAQVL